MHKNKLFKKGLVIGILVLFVCISLVPIAGSLSIERVSTASQIQKSNLDDDTTPPVTTIYWSTTEVVSTESTDHSYVSSLMMDGDGTLHVAWHDHTDYSGSGTDSDIFYKYKPSGGSWSTTEVVSTESTGSSEQPSLMVDGDGTVHVAWMDETNYAGSGFDYDIFYKYKPSGGSWSTTEVVSTQSTGISWYPSLMVDVDGTVHVAWEDWTNYGGSGSDPDIFYKYKLSGGSWSTTEVVSTESTSFSEQSSLMVDGDGTVHVAWDDGTDYGGSGSDYDIFYKYKLSGGSWSTTEVVSTESTYHSGRPSLMVDGDGTVHVAWEDLTEYGGSGSDRDVFYNHKPSGGSWSTTEVVSTESTSSSWSPSLTADDDCVVNVAWDDGTNYGGSGSDSDIFYKCKPSGGSWSTTEVVSTESTDTSWWPSLMVDDDGTVHVTWQDWTNYGGSGTDRDIFYNYKAPPLRANAHGPYYGESGTLVSFTGSATGGTPPYSWLWDFGDGNTSDEQNPTHVYSTPGNYTVILTVTDDSDDSSDDTTWAYIYPGNNPPNAPTITGETNGKAGTEYEYTFISTDPDGDNVSFFVDWGDDTTSGWTEYVPSGTTVILNHTWTEQGTYTVKAKARDEQGAESDWGSLTVKMPISYLQSMPHPLLKAILTAIEFVKGSVLFG